MNLDAHTRGDCRICDRDIGPGLGDPICDDCLRGQTYNLNHWCKRLHKLSADAGWWNDALRSEDGDVLNHPDNMNLFATKIALIHSEVSEMLEGLRKGLPDDHLPERSMEEVEAADIFIRLADYCGARDIDLMNAVCAKLGYNKRRADHKQEAREAEGGKKF